MIGFLNKAAVRLVLALATVAVGPALAHKGSDAYLDVQQVVLAAAGAAPASAGVRDVRFVLSVAIKDLDLLVPLDANADARVTWGEVKAAMPQVQALLNGAATISAGGDASTGAAPCRLDWQSDGLERRSDGTYVRMTAQARCPAAQALLLNYTLLGNVDATHRLLVAGRMAGRDLLTTTSPLQKTGLLLSPGIPQDVGMAAESPPSGRWAALRAYFSLGMHHLLEGFDHLAFLLALVLPLQLVLGFRAGRASASAKAGSAWWALLRTATAFTLGHSITLVLATLGVTQASPLWVEPVIALSIAVTALLNLRPVHWVRTDVLALLFGLVHGFGFAGLLQEAAAPEGLLPWALAGFNLGVEAGQLMAVAVWVLVSQLVVRKPWYHRVVVRGGSVLLILVAAWWFQQRVF
ncbi:HupE/UreJ family protein [Polaromonas sp.]|uniref:HupE/UreJ family protein n=1 Tax=Polaromonas sp. TaxID=1869339 RepID=UPI001E0022D4|nr:HupE/UreJ family protein [Polaromonas sp.]MBT9476739.1 HupE/UreJ family protein [Polaromonas sp.]